MWNFPFQFKHYIVETTGFGLKIPFMHSYRSTRNLFTEIASWKRIHIVRISVDSSVCRMKVLIQVVFSVAVFTTGIRGNAIISFDIHFITFLRIVIILVLPQKIHLVDDSISFCYTYNPERIRYIYQTFAQVEVRHLLAEIIIKRACTEHRIHRTSIGWFIRGFWKFVLTNGARLEE